MDTRNLPILNPKGGVTRFLLGFFGGLTVIWLAPRMLRLLVRSLFGAFGRALAVVTLGILAEKATEWMVDEE